MKADKAFETNLILNWTLKILRKTMTKRLIFISQACIDVEDYSKSFREAKIILLKKVEKTDYTIFKVYRSIALWNTINKMLKSIIIDKITKFAKTGLLLSKSQISVKKIETISKMLTEKIHAIWKQKRNKVVTILSVNVTKTYDHVLCTGFFHNLKKIRISNQIIQWVKSFLKERKLSIVFKRKISEISNVNAEISQKFSVSSIMYLFFNTNLLNICKQSKRKPIFIEFVNDVNVLTYNTSTKQHCKTLKKPHEVFKTWFRRHEIRFSLTKYKLIYLSRSLIKFNKK